MVTVALSAHQGLTFERNPLGTMSDAISAQIVRRGELPVINSEINDSVVSIDHLGCFRLEELPMSSCY